MEGVIPGIHHLIPESDIAPPEPFSLSGTIPATVFDMARLARVVIPNIPHHTPGKVKGEMLSPIGEVPRQAHEKRQGLCEIGPEKTQQ